MNGKSLKRGFTFRLQLSIIPGANYPRVGGAFDCESTTSMGSVDHIHRADQESSLQVLGPRVCALRTRDDRVSEDEEGGNDMYVVFIGISLSLSVCFPGYSSLWPGSAQQRTRIRNSSWVTLRRRAACRSATRVLRWESICRKE